jgi:hypothetical protein
MKYIKNYAFYVRSIIFLAVVILIAGLAPAFAQFTPTQNAYLNRNELLLNGDAEQGSVNWLSSPSASSVNTDYFSGTRSFEINLVGQTLSFCQSVSTAVKLKNANLGSACQIKTTNADIQICNNVNGTNQDCASINNSGEWQASSPSSSFVAGSGTSGLCIISTVAITDTVRVDNCSLNEILAMTKGGTGIGSSGVTGNVLTSNGSSWVSYPLPDSIQLMNTLAATQQFLITGTTGSDFNIVSTIDTHKFNLPVATSTKSGKLSSTDWTTFNSKEPAITVLPVIKGGTGLSVVGSSGNVLTSNGSVWVSSAPTSAISSLNGETAASQTFATGTSGTDFAISSSSGVHTFDLPIASVTNTGKLSSTDWTTFNNKQDTITILPVANGGTGLSTIPLNNVILGNATSAVQSVSPSTAGNILTSDGTTWISAPNGGGTTVLNASDLTLTASDSLAVSTTELLQRWLVQASAGPITMSTTPFGGVAPVDGTEIVVIGNSDTETVEFTNNDIAYGCIVNGSLILTRYKIVTFIYNLSLNRYVEKSRNF